MVDRVSGRHELRNPERRQVSRFGLRDLNSRHRAAKVFAQTVKYYDGETFVGLPFGQLGDFGALGPHGNPGPDRGNYCPELIARRTRSQCRPPCRPICGPASSSWPGEYPEGVPGQNTAALAGYIYARSADIPPGLLRGYRASAYDFHMTAACGSRGLPVCRVTHSAGDTTVAYDALPSASRAGDGRSGAHDRREHDYRVLQPRWSPMPTATGELGFSPLGFCTATAGARQGECEGDLDNPGRLRYDFFAFVNGGQPVFVRTIGCQHHDTETDVPLPQRDETIETVEYSDGFGRLLQTRAQAEDVRFGDPTFGGGILPADQSQCRPGRRCRPARNAGATRPMSSSAAGRSTTTRAGWSRSTSRSSPWAGTTPHRTTPSSARRPRCSTTRAAR